MYIPDRIDQSPVKSSTIIEKQYHHVDALHHS